MYLCTRIQRSLKIRIKLKRFTQLSVLGLSLAVCLVSTGCQKSRVEGPGEGGSARQVVLTEDKSDSVMSEMSIQLEREVVLDRVKTIYNIVEHECTYMGGSVENDLLDKQFCTKSWNKLMLAIRRKEYKTNTLFFEVNHWTMTQDATLVDFDEFEVTDCVVRSPKERTASVEFTVYEANTYTPARIELVYEDGQWKIDNFHQLKYMLNIRECMWQYLDNDIMSYLI